LNVKAVPAPITVTPATLDFGSLSVGLTSGVKTAIYTNGSTQPATIVSVEKQGPDAGDFTIVDQSCENQTVPPGGTCLVSLTFTPSHQGAHTASLVITDNQSGGPRVVTLTGIGLPPAPFVCPSVAALSFPLTQVGSTSAVQSVTITNCGSAALFITNDVLTTGEFIFDGDTCSNSTVNAGDVCTIGIRFVPSGAGARAASLKINDSADGSPHTVTLTGTAAIPVPGLCFNPTAVNFGNLPVGQNSATHSVILSNCGTAKLDIFTVSLTGTGAVQYSIVGDTCSSNSLLPGATCTVGLVFHPTTIGSANTALSVNDNAPGSPQTVAITSVGIGSQPDGSISRSRKPSKFVGAGIINDTGASQTVSLKAGHGRKKVFYVAIRNAGNVSDSFLVQGSGDVAQGFTVRYFLGAIPRQSLDITDAVKAGTYTTSTLAAGATTGDATLIRVEMKVTKDATTGFKPNLIKLISTTDPSKSDTVQATVAVP
jgi:hypothetical protein